MKAIILLTALLFSFSSFAADVPKKPDAKNSSVVKKAEPKKDLGDKKPTPKKNKA